MPSSAGSNTDPVTWPNSSASSRPRPSTARPTTGWPSLRLALEDLDAQVAKFESEIDAVRGREDRDRSMLEAGAINAKQLADLQHELETLQRRQSSLEDSLLEVMERREELQSQQAGELANIDALESDLAEAQRARDDALTVIEQTRHQCVSRRDELTAALDSDLVALYERQRSHGGAGAGTAAGPPVRRMPDRDRPRRARPNLRRRR